MKIRLKHCGANSLLGTLVLMLPDNEYDLNKLGHVDFYITPSGPELDVAREILKLSQYLNDFSVYVVSYNTELEA